MVEIEKKEKIKSPVRIDIIADEVLEKIKTMRRDKGGVLEPAEWEEQMNHILDQLSGGRYLDPRNVSHVVGAVPLNESKFDKDERLDAKTLLFSGSFWFSAHGNSYAPYADRIVIFSPKNRFLQKFLKSFGAYYQAEHNPWWVAAGLRSPEVLPHAKENLENFMQGKPLVKDDRGDRFNWGEVHLEGWRHNFNNRHGDEDPKLVEYRKNLPRLPRWSDIADCIIDLKKGEVYFYS